MVSLEMIEDLKIFENFEKAELEKILEICVLEKYQQGDRLFREGDEAKNLWIVKQGEVQLRFEMPDSKPSSDDKSISSHDNEDVVAPRHINVQLSLLSLYKTLVL